MFFYIFIILFFQKIYPTTISFFKKNTINNSLKTTWHLDFFKQTKLPLLTGKNTVIVIIDSKIYENNSICNNGPGFQLNLSQNKSHNFPLINTQKNKNHSSGEMKKKGDLREFSQKNHGDYTLGIIRQLAPEARIISIPILDDRGYTDKENVYQALKLAKTYNPDILHLGFQILDFDHKQKLDKKIYQLLKKFTLVVIPIGNNLKTNFPPKLPQVFSVASFGKKSNGYQISEFCQKISYADFIMPGEDISIKILDSTIKDYRTLYVTGTSFAAAIMTGFLSLLFQKNHKKLPLIMIDLIKLSSFLEDDWQNKIRYGFPHF